MLAIDALVGNNARDPMSISSNTGPLLRLVPVPKRDPIRPTSGKDLLARAEFRLQRRRRLLLITPMLLASLWGAVNVIAWRADGLGSASFLRRGFDDVLVLSWIAALIFVPFASALKPKPVRAGAIVAFLAGPVLMPPIFGRGWGALPSMIALGACIAAVLGPRALRTLR